MGKLLKLKSLLWIAACLLATSKCFAGIEPSSASVLGPFFSLPVNTSLLTFAETKFANNDFGNIASQTVQNAITLKVNDNIPITSAFTYTLNIYIQTFSDVANPNTPDATVLSTSLTVSYVPGKGASYKGLATYTFTGAYKVNILFQSSSFTGMPPTANMVTLGCNIVVNRQYNFNSSASIPSVASAFVNGTDDSGNSNKQLSLTWGAIQGAEDYDVEWTTIDRGDDYAGSAASMAAGSTPSDPTDAIFKNNATRITTSGQAYKISMVYDDDYLLVRIRQVQYTAAGVRLEGDWNYLCTDGSGNTTGAYLAWDLKPPGGTAYAYHQNRNYQYSAAFAEEGKKKEVISFFDGTLRNRQTVTVDNSTNVPIVQENVYDEFGRPAASILPAPTSPDGSGVSLKYFKLFNLYANPASGIALIPYDFKALKATISACENTPSTMAFSNGAAQYYSASNPFMSAINSWVANPGSNPNPYPTLKNTSYIPDAQQYPFSVTQYTPDNTGRIKLQGGVGAGFQPGNPNPNNYANSKVTRYFYGKPEQWELDRLFGNDVGYAEHYFKNMVVDANNQISISYLNASGKTIATALTGLVPGNVDPLPSVSDPSSTVNPIVQILNPKQFAFDPTALKISASTTYLASNTGQVHFSYSMQQLINSIVSNTSSASVCSNCYYDLHIMVYDVCNTPVHDEIVHIGAKLNNGNDAAATSCGPNAAYTNSFDATLSNIGEYHISFEFIFSKSVLEDYVNNYITKGQANGLVRTQWSFLYPFLQGLDFSGCLSDCKTCLQTLGSETDFTNMFNQKLAAMGVDPSILLLSDYTNYVHTTYINLLAQCTSLAGSCDLSPCSKYETLMEQDVSPGGQYALYDSNYLPLEPAINVLYQNWRTIFPILPSTSAIYQSELVNTYSAATTLTSLPVANVTSPYDASFTFADLIKYWKTDWAVKFLPYHPEYCKLAFCYLTSTFHSWDEHIQAVDDVNNLNTVLGSLATPVYSPTNDDWLFNSDPAFGTNTIFSTTKYPGQNVKSLSDQFKADLESYSYNVLNQTTAATQPVKGLSAMVDYLLYAADLQGADQSTSYWNYNASSCRILNRNWAAYQGYYFDLKQKYYDLASQLTTCQYVCPIGQPVSFVAGNAYTCPQAADFMISPLSSTDTPVGTLATHSKWITVTYLPGKILEDATLSLYYPNTTTGSSLTLVIPTGASKGFLQIPDSIPVNTVKIQTITCNYGARLNYNDQLKNGRYVYDDGHGMRYEYLTKVGRADQKPVDLIDSLGGKATQPNYYSSITFNSLNGGKDVKLDHVWLSFTYTTYDVGGHQKGSAGDETVNIPANIDNLGGAPLTPQNQNNNNTVIKAIKQPLANNKGLKQTINFPKLDDTGTGCNNPTDFYISSYILNYTYNGQTGIMFYVNVKPQLDQCDRSANIPFTLTVNYNDPNDEDNAQSLTVSSVVDKEYLSGYVFVPMTNFTSASLCGNVGPCSGSSTCNNAYQYKQSRFLTIDQTTPYATDYSSATANGQAAITTQMQSTCNASSLIWMKALDPGLTTLGLTDAQKTTLQNGLIGICQGGGDFQHPFGSSTLSNTTTTIPTTTILPSLSGTNNFADVILQNVTQLGGKFTDAINPWLIGGPGPYFPVSPSGPITVSHTTTDINNAIIAIQTQAAGSGLSTYQYMVNNYGAAMTLSQADLTALTNAYGTCDNWLPYDMDIPVFLQKPGFGSVNATTYNNTKNSLAQYFSDSGSWPNTPNYKQIITNFLNQSFGFLLTYDQYSAYETTLASNANAILCNNPPFKNAARNDYACIDATLDNAVNNALVAYNSYIADQENIFRQGYIATCSAASASVNMQTNEQQYHYTLYYYDQADNLIRTVPPEGVNLIPSTQWAQVDAIRDAQVNISGNCTYSSAGVSTSKTGMQADLGTALSTSGASAIEMWLYNANPANINQFTEVATDASGNNEWLFNMAINGTTIGFDMYPMTAITNGALFSPASSSYRATLPSGGQTQWTHVVIQNTTGIGQGTLPQIWVDGVQLTVTTGKTPIGSWTVSANANGTIQYPDIMGTVKHIRFYPRELYTNTSPTEIAVNAANTCMMPENTPASWYRFNIPGVNGPTSIAANTTDESTLSGGIFASHALMTNYQYNSTNQVVWQNSPDGGTNRFWYDMLSRLNISQNDKQLATGDFSYTTYEKVLGRITEVGQKNVGSGIANTSAIVSTAPGYLDQATLGYFNAGGTNSQITHTWYDGPATGTGMFTIAEQDNLRKRVAAITYTDGQPNSPLQATYYNYDIDGNVKTLWQQIGGLTTVTNLGDPTQLKRLDYEYDLISGKVNFVRYQDGQPDRFYYNYKYDAENRLTEAWSGPDAMVDAYNGSYLLDYNRRKNAAYYYYLHGPLARTELGDAGGIVQGIDYAYTLQGWLKGVNATNLNDDMWKDGLATGYPSSSMTKDAYAYSLGYYAGDYSAIGGSNALALAQQYQQQSGDPTGQSLYNGNISNTTLAIGAINSGTAVGYTYHYDQLNRLKKMRQHNNISGTQWDRNSIVTDATGLNSNYGEDIDYDGNGNILHYKRQGAGAPTTANLMDSLSYGYTYYYNPGDPKPYLTNNRLRHVIDNLPDANGFTTDIKKQNPDNYSYDAIGNLIQDSQAGISNITWTAFGKINTLTKSSGNISYMYGPGAQRVSKLAGGLTTWYVRDVQGNTMGVYDNAGSANNWREQHLYGSSRLGMWTPNVNLATANAAETEWGNIGHTSYELNNYLGNVLATITDKRVQNVTTDNNGNQIISNYDADVATAQDYYPFGMQMPGRTSVITYDATTQTYSMQQGTGNYRYGFNGKENDNEVKGVGDQQDYGMRIYDPRVGRFLSVDPLTSKYPELTPYQFASNTPIQAIDLDGKEARHMINGGIMRSPSQAEFQKQRPNDISFWKDQVLFEKLYPFKNLIDANPNIRRQAMADASGGDLNVDYWELKGTLPKGMTAKELYNALRINLDNYMNYDESTVGTQDPAMKKLWGSNDPTGAVMVFYPFATDHSAVLTSKSGSDYWVFTPIWTTTEWRHPLAGQRQFGLTDNGDGTFTFYTRAIDRMWTPQDAYYNFNGFIPLGGVLSLRNRNVFFNIDAAKTWGGLMDNVVKFINSIGGTAKRTTSFNKQVPWKDVAGN